MLARTRKIGLELLYARPNRFFLLQNIRTGYCRFSQCYMSSDEPWAFDYDSARVYSQLSDRSLVHNRQANVTNTVQ
jgi:hypothetical protein